MKTFLKKEWMETIRTGRGFLLLLIFGLFGIMNPAIARLTPWMMKVMSESLRDAGFVMTAVEVNAMISWSQFYKNIPLALIIFVLLVSGSFTGEYQKGTLIPVVTRGLSRRKIVAAKALMIMGLWTSGYFLSFGITFAYNEYFWGNGIASHLLFGAVCFWLFGLWVLGILLFLSTAARTGTQVLFGTGAAALGIYVLGMLPAPGRWLPARLMDGMSLLQGHTVPADYFKNVIIACAMTALFLHFSVLCFDRKRL